MEGLIGLKNTIIQKLGDQISQIGIQDVAKKVSISPGHLHKLVKRPDQYPLSDKMKLRIESSGILDD